MINQIHPTAAFFRLKARKRSSCIQVWILALPTTVRPVLCELVKHVM